MVIQFAEYQEDPHLSGEAVCLACGHTWIAVAPIGTVYLECPECHVQRGRLRFPVQHDEPHWECVCGNQLFHITPSGMYCPNCGLAAKGF